MRTRTAACWMLGLTLLMAPTAAAPSPASEGSLLRLSKHAWMWVSDEDRSANGLLLEGTKAAMLVDPGLTPLHARRFLAAARQVTKRPIGLAVITHWHADHGLGALCLGEPGIELLAHPRTRELLAERVKDVQKELIAGAPNAAEREALERCQPVLPTHLVATDETIDLGGLAVRISHPGAAHTPGDLVVWVPSEKVLATGDLFLRDSSPSMGEGSVRVWIEALRRLEALGPQHVVPGHFAASRAADLMRFRSYLEALAQYAGAGLARGRSPEELARTASFPAFARFRQYPNYQATFADNARTVAEELRAAAPREGEAPTTTPRRDHADPSHP